MAARRTLPIVTLFAVLLVAAGAFMGQARAQSASRQPDFAYVGLSSTLCRIDAASGQMWVLKNRLNQHLTLQGMPQADGWQWLKIKGPGEQRQDRPTGPASSMKPNG